VCERERDREREREREKEREGLEAVVATCPHSGALLSTDPLPSSMRWWRARDTATLT